ncbi:3-methyl-2-oxobutanoate hydroxymethyltransferase, partial [Staphylococcus aureus]
TAYEFPSAEQVEAGGLDMALCGALLDKAVLGYESSGQVPLAEMIHRGLAVRRGTPKPFVVVDMPVGAVGIAITQDV